MKTTKNQTTHKSHLQRKHPLVKKFRERYHPRTISNDFNKIAIVEC